MAALVEAEKSQFPSCHLQPEEGQHGHSGALVPGTLGVYGVDLTLLPEMKGPSHHITLTLRHTVLPSLHLCHQGKDLMLRHAWQSVY